MKFDLVFSNPPYNGNVDLKILKEIVPIANEIVVVHPSTWLIDMKCVKKLFTDLKLLLNGRLLSAEIFDGNKVFNIDLHVPVVITHIKDNNTGAYNVSIFGDEFKTNSLDDITKFGKDWENIVKPFRESIMKGSESFIWEKRISKEDVRDNFSHCQISAVNGAGARTFTITGKDTQKIKYINNPDARKDGFLVWQFDTDGERDNFVEYLKTDFARFCFCLLKNNGNNHCGEMALIPWLDFTQSWDDEKLYKHFNIDEETQEYIREFLPDYYGIRGNTTSDTNKEED